MKKVALYCDERSLNDATKYYVNIIKECIIEQNYDFKIVHNLNAIKDVDIVFTITEKYFFIAKVLFPQKKTIYWSQGIGAEEAKLNRGKDFRYYFRILSEYFAVRKSNLLFMVSDKMKDYLKSKYRYNGNNYVIMPCYNLKISDYFDVNQYNSPTFVYAGNASVWQSVDLMLDVFKLVEKNIPDSSLTILTSDIENIEKKIKDRNILRYTIKYVSIDNLQDELHKYKYGFILREDNIVNNVATPTKMNSYLSNYLIPIFSDAVEDFRKHIHLDKYTIMANCPLNSMEICDIICDFENDNKEFSSYKLYVDRVFYDHYNDKKYKIEIISKLKELDL